MSQVRLRSSIQPVILAGGLGTRLLPRTKLLPKPLLPVDGRPLLWYTLNSLEGLDVKPPVVGLDYLGDLIETYFARTSVTFRRFAKTSMAEVMLQLAEEGDADAFLGMSADVLLGPGAVDLTLQAYEQSGGLDTALFVNLSAPGHKKWKFVVEHGRLSDIQLAPTNTPFERLLLVLRRDSLLRLREVLPKPVTDGGLPSDLRPFQSGWTLILKCLCREHIPVAASVVDLAVCNINEPPDFDGAEQFVLRHRRTTQNA